MEKESTTVPEKKNSFSFRKAIEATPDGEMKNFLKTFYEFFKLIPRHKSFELACRVYISENEVPSHFPSSDESVNAEHVMKNKYYVAPKKDDKHPYDKPVCIARYGKVVKLDNLLNRGPPMPYSGPPLDKKDSSTSTSQSETKSSQSGTSDSSNSSKSSASYSTTTTTTTAPSDSDPTSDLSYCDIPPHVLSTRSSPVGPVNIQKSEPKIAPTTKKSRIVPLGEYDFVRSPFLDSPQVTSGDKTKAKNYNKKVTEDDDPYCLDLITGLPKKKRSEMTLLEANKQMGNKINYDSVSSSTISTPTHYENLYISPKYGRTPLFFNSSDARTSSKSSSDSTFYDDVIHAGCVDSQKTIPSSRSSTSSSISSAVSSDLKQPKSTSISYYSVDSSEQNSGNMERTILSAPPPTLTSSTVSSFSNTTNTITSTNYVFDRNASDGWTYLTSKPSKDYNTSPSLFININDLF